MKSKIGIGIVLMLTIVAGVFLVSALSGDEDQAEEPSESVMKQDVQQPGCGAGNCDADSCDGSCGGTCGVKSCGCGR